MKEMTPEQEAEFKREASIMVNTQPHQNIVKLYGVCVEPSYPLAIVTEYLEGGSLRDLLATKEFKVIELIKIAKDIVKGMKHLQHENLVHRDLSARNILMSQTKDGWIAKISDFGLSRSVDTETQKGQTISGVGPLKWMAPESLVYKQYSIKSDVWSFGITVIELFTRGEEPYPNMDSVQAASAVMHQNLRPDIPDNCPPRLAQLLLDCFSREPSKRPEWKEILVTLDETESDLESNPFYNQ